MFALITPRANGTRTKNADWAEGVLAKQARGGLLRRIQAVPLLRRGKPRLYGCFSSASNRSLRSIPQR
jgi:hypothetical protein